MSLFEITEDDVERRRAALGTILDMMNVPEMRKTPTNANIRWLSRNLAIQNGDHPMLQVAQDLIKWLLRRPRG